MRTTATGSASSATRAASPRCCSAARDASKAAGSSRPRACSRTSCIVDKFNKRGSERAEFDWENGIANLHDNKTAPLELPTFDLLALMWQFYFQPPDSDVQTFALATTKRVYKVTGTRKRRETHRVGATARSRPRCGIAPARTEGPKATSGSRRRCAGCR